MKSDAKRRADARWDAKNMSVISAKLRRDLAESFKAAAKSNGTTPNALIRGWIDAYMQQNNPVE